jgi:tetratricopeptide (TPR) repeat protein
LPHRPGGERSFADARITCAGAAMIATFDTRDDAIMKRLSMKRLALACAVVVAAAALAAVLVGSDDSGERCFKEEGETAIAACGRAIQSGRFDGPQLATIYDNRAMELRQQGDYDRAIADYTQAIRVEGEMTGAYTGRGLAYEGKADIDKAKADYKKALEIAAKYDDGEWAHDTARQRLDALDGK